MFLICACLTEVCHLGAFFRLSAVACKVEKTLQAAAAIRGAAEWYKNQLIRQIKNIPLQTTLLHLFQIQYV